MRLCQLEDKIVVPRLPQRRSFTGRDRGFGRTLDGEAHRVEYAQLLVSPMSLNFTNAIYT